MGQHRGAQKRPFNERADSNIVLTIFSGDSHIRQRHVHPASTAPGVGVGVSA